MPALALPRRLRLAHARQFDAVRRGGVRRQAGPLAVSGRPNGLAYPRLGLSVGRGVGGAVVRGRVKRLLREAFRHEQHALPTLAEGEGVASGYDLVIAVRPHEALSLEDYRRLLREAADAVHREWGRRRAQSSKQ